LRRARIGSRILAMAEEEGRRRGCTWIALTTLSVEAPWFYQKQGDGFAARAVRIEHAGRAAGYAYISAQGQVGPLAIAPDADAKAVVTTALRCALEGARQVSMIVPGRAEIVMQTVLALGFRIEEPYVLMAQRPFGNSCNYLPGTPGFM
jgi:hypothetical protein